MKKILCVFLILVSSLAFSQVGINTNTPQAIFHIDGEGNNEQSSSNVIDDLVFTHDGKLGIGTTTPTNKLQIVGDGVNHPLNIKKMQPLSDESTLLYVDKNGNIGTNSSNSAMVTQVFVLNAKVPTRGPQGNASNNGYNISTGIDLHDLSARNYMPWVALTPAGGNTQTITQVSNSLVATIENTNYIKIPKTGYYSIQVQGTFSCDGYSSSGVLVFYALDMIMYKGTVANVQSANEVERIRIVVGRNDTTSYPGSFYTVVKLNENDYISFAIAPGSKDDGTPIPSSSNIAYRCGIGTPSGNTANFSSISLILL